MIGPATDAASRDRRWAMRLSLATGFLMLAGKMTAYALTGSVAILSDAAESVIHVLAVAFAAFALGLSERPATRESPYGYERITFFSAGFEGGMIIIAALVIIAAAAEKWWHGLEIERLGLGTLITLGASLVNLVLGLYLVRVGRRRNSLILEANGQHVLTDSWTSFGVVGGLCLVLLTGWKPFDPLFAIAVALNILWSGGQLVKRSVRGLLDLPDSGQSQKLQQAVDRAAATLGVEAHRMRFRDTGQHIIMSVHLLFPDEMPVGEAHRRATEFEQRLGEEAGVPVEVITHLEAAGDHDVLHPTENPF
jgi:cation diffusion facilitator family transporter